MSARITDYPFWIAAIRQEPDNDALRLQMADWFDDVGQEERGEFVRVQVTLARWDWGPVWKESDHIAIKCDCYGCGFRRREQSLLTAHEHEWLGNALFQARYNDSRSELRAAVPTIWKRGFVESLMCAAEIWLTHADAILAEQPVREVTLTTLPIVNYSFLRQEHCLQIQGRERWHKEIFAVGRLLSEMLKDIFEREWEGVHFTIACPLYPAPWLPDDGGPLTVPWIPEDTNPPPRR
jgi:uncharacterized protein (TIGR02996 family)